MGQQTKVPLPDAARETLRQPLLEPLLSPANPPRMSYEEFLAWADEDTYAEWVDGEVIMMSPESDRHQDLARFLTSVLGIYVETYAFWVWSARHRSR